MALRDAHAGLRAGLSQGAANGQVKGPVWLPQSSAMDCTAVKVPSDVKTGNITHRKTTTHRILSHADTALPLERLAKRKKSAALLNKLEAK